METQGDSLSNMVDEERGEGDMEGEASEYRPSLLQSWRSWLPWVVGVIAVIGIGYYVYTHNAGSGATQTDNSGGGGGDTGNPNTGSAGDTGTAANDTAALQGLADAQSNAIQSLGNGLQSDLQAIQQNETQNQVDMTNFFKSFEQNQAQANAEFASQLAEQHAATTPEEPAPIQTQVPSPVAKPNAAPPTEPGPNQSVPVGSTLTLSGGGGTYTSSAPTVTATNVPSSYQGSTTYTPTQEGGIYVHGVNGTGFYAPQGSSAYNALTGGS